MKKYTVKKDGRYWTRDGAREGFITPGIAGCYSYPLAGALWVKAHKGGEIVEVAKDKSGKTVEGEQWDGRLLILEVLTPSTIADGSGIVGIEQDEENYTVYYEGNIYNAANLTKWEDRVRHAAGRMLAAYPTVARGQFPKAKFKVIGYYQSGTGEIYHEHPDYSREDWRQEVADDNTLLGYWEWVDHQLEAK
jgi:hypothetical protein